MSERGSSAMERERVEIVGQRGYRPLTVIATNQVTSPVGIAFEPGHHPRQISFRLYSNAWRDLDYLEREHALSNADPLIIPNTPAYFPTITKWSLTEGLSLNRSRQLVVFVPIGSNLDISNNAAPCELIGRINNVRLENMGSVYANHIPTLGGTTLEATNVARLQRSRPNLCLAPNDVTLLNVKEFDYVSHTVTEQDIKAQDCSKVRIVGGRVNVVVQSKDLSIFSLTTSGPTYASVDATLCRPIIDIRRDGDHNLREQNLDDITINVGSVSCARLQNTPAVINEHGMRTVIALPNKALSRERSSFFKSKPVIASILRDHENALMVNQSWQGSAPIAGIDHRPEVHYPDINIHHVAAQVVAKYDSPLRKNEGYVIDSSNAKFPIARCELTAEDLQFTQPTRGVRPTAAIATTIAFGLRPPGLS